MPRFRLRLFACAVLLLAVVAPLGVVLRTASPTVGAQAPATPAVASPAAELSQTLPQPSYDVLRLEQNGAIVPYSIWVDWTPILVTTPDGGAWAFFSAQARLPEGPGTRRLYATRFDPTSHVWLPATALPGGQIQYGPTAVVDSSGAVHLVFSDRASDAPDAFSTLVYTRSTPEGGWDPPVPIAPDPDAGHQMMPALAIDANDGLHLLWRDQRNVASESRAALVANADLFASNLVANAWTTPVQVNRRPSPDINAGWPYLVVDGDRLVALWSSYRGSTAAEMRRAVGVEWSSRPITSPTGWSEPAPLLDRSNGETGGRSLDLVADPTGGGVILVYGSLGQRTNDLFLRRLDRAATQWGAETALSSGDQGYLPSISVDPNGTTLLVFNTGQNRNVEVGGWAIPPDGIVSQTEPVVLTPGEEGEHGRAAVAVGADGQPWILYMHSASGSATATEMRVLRGAELGD